MLTLGPERLLRRKASASRLYLHRLNVAQFPRPVFSALRLVLRCSKEEGICDLKDFMDIENLA